MSKYRAGVGIVLVNKAKQVFLAKRIGKNAWQFPQGGILDNEDELDAALREIWEEVGIEPEQITLLAKSSKWLTYKTPKQLIRKTPNHYIGQTQKWFLFSLNDHSTTINFLNTKTPEFDSSKWVDFWEPVKEVVHFKKKVYQQVLQEFYPKVFRNKREIKSNYLRMRNNKSSVAKNNSYDK